MSVVSEMSSIILLIISIYAYAGLIIHRSKNSVYIYRDKCVFTSICFSTLLVCFKENLVVGASIRAGNEWVEPCLVQFVLINSATLTINYEY